MQTERADRATQIYSDLQELVRDFLRQQSLNLLNLRC